MNAGTRIFASLSLCAAATALTVAFAARNVAAAGNPSANIDQCANGLVYATVPCTGSAWQNGNTNANNSHWFEGDSIAYRMTFSSMSVGPTHRVTIQWDTTKSGAHALDYLTSYDRTEKVANGDDPSAGVSGCGSPTTFAIPADNHSRPTLQPSADDGRWNQVFTMFNGTITSVTVKDPALGNPEVPYNLTGTYAGDSSTSITITFTAANSTPVLAWGGHVATRKDWGAIHSALAITGSPYHMRLLNVDGSGGNQDRSTASSAIIFPALLTITKTVLDSFGQPLIGPTRFNYTTTSPNLSGAGAELPAAFTLVQDGGVNALTGLANNQQQFKLYIFDTSSAQVTVTEQPTAGFILGSLTCTASVNGVPQTGFTVDLASGTITGIPVEGEDINCTYVNQQALILTLIKKVINTNGGTALPSAFTLRVTGSNGTNLARPGSATGTVYPVLPGTYTVSETALSGYRLAGFSGDCDAS